MPAGTPAGRVRRTAFESVCPRGAVGHVRARHVAPAAISPVLRGRADKEREPAPRRKALLVCDEPPAAARTSGIACPYFESSQVGVPARNCWEQFRHPWSLSKRASGPRQNVAGRALFRRPIGARSGLSRIPFQPSTARAAALLPLLYTNASGDSRCAGLLSFFHSMDGSTAMVTPGWLRAPSTSIITSTSPGGALSGRRTLIS